MPSHYRSLEEMYVSAPCHENGWEGIQIRIAEGKTLINARIGPHQHHAAGSVHGSFLFKLLDDAAFFAAQSAQSEYFVLTQSFHLHFFRPFAQGEVVAEGSLTRNGGNVLFASSSLRTVQGKILAEGTGVFAVSSIALDSVPGYAG